MDIVWSRIVSPSGYRDGVYGICVFRDRVYAAGFDELFGLGRKRYRVESYSVSDGTPLSRWADEKGYQMAFLSSCVPAKDGIYVFGATDRFWSILLFDRDLNLVKKVDIDKPYVVPFSATVIDGNVYVVGTAVSPDGLNSIYVAKVNPDTLSIEKVFSMDREGRGAGAYSIAFIKTANRFVVGGFDRVEGSMNWLLVFLSKDLELIKISRPPVKGCITSLSVNAEGSIYAVDRSTLAKLGREGELQLSTTLVQGVKLYSSQEASTPLGLNVVVVQDNNVFLVSSDRLSLVDSTRLSRGPQILTAFVGSMDFDGDKVYVGLTQVVTKDDWNWAILALRPRVRRFRLFGR